LSASIRSGDKPTSTNMFLTWMISNLLSFLITIFNKFKNSLSWLAVSNIYEPLDKSLSVSKGNFLNADSTIFSFIFVNARGLPFTGPNRLYGSWILHSGKSVISLTKLFRSSSSWPCYLVCCPRISSRRVSRVTNSLLVKLTSSDSLQYSKSYWLPNKDS